MSKKDKYTTMIVCLKNNKEVSKVMVEDSVTTVDLSHNYEPDPVEAMQQGIEPKIISTHGEILITGKVTKWEKME